jgi:transcriptional regulatory protein RtcR
MAKRTVVYGFLGSNLDRGQGPGRWDQWRPSVALCQHEELVVDRFVLLHNDRDRSIARQVRADLAQVSPETAVELREVTFRNPWDFEEVYAGLHDFARAERWDTAKDDYLLHITTGTHVVQICLFLLAESRHLPGRLLQTSPPRGRAGSGPGHYAVIDLDLSKYDRLASRFKEEQREGASLLKAGIATRNAAFNHLIDRLEQVALGSKAPVLLSGPTGAGKSQLARRVYALKKQRGQVEGPLVEVNCATLRGDQAMSALFGHVRGAFTGAQRDRPGLLREADRGLLFLDEIGELGPDEQAMLLRALEEKRFLPLGADHEAKSDFQLIAGTNRDLLTEVGEGRFREDLLRRIDVWSFRLPGLRERPEDLAPNLDHELAQASAQLGRQVALSREARERFLQFAARPESRWTGNFRDLNAAVLRMATLAAGGRIDVKLVEEEEARLRASWSGPVQAGQGEGALDGLLPARDLAALDPFDRVQLEAVVAACKSAASLSEAGRALFAKSRLTKKSQNDADRLRKYLVRFGLEWSALRGA